MGTLNRRRTRSRTAIPPAGLAELYEQHSDTVYRTALRVTGNPADAETRSKPSSFA